MRYSDKVNDHFNNPRNMGSMDRQDPQVGTAVVGAPACGDVKMLSLKHSAVVQPSHRHHWSQRWSKVKRLMKP